MRFSSTVIGCLRIVFWSALARHRRRVYFAVRLEQLSGDDNVDAQLGQRGFESVDFASIAVDEFLQQFAAVD